MQDFNTPFDKGGQPNNSDIINYMMYVVGSPERFPTTAPILIRTKLSQAPSNLSFDNVAQLLRQIDRFVGVCFAKTCYPQRADQRTPENDWNKNTKCVDVSDCTMVWLKHLLV